MEIKTVYVCRFRGLRSQSIHFDTGINELIGTNAEGKSSVLEAVHLLILGISFRTHQLSHLIQHGESSFLVEAEVSLDGIHRTISLSYDGERRRVSIDGIAQESSSSLLGNLLGVTATLEDQELVFGPPAVRRRFLDEQIAQIDPKYTQLLSRYRRALSQRNQLLKRKELHTIEAWEEQLALSGSYLIEQRNRTVEQLRPKVEQAYQNLFPNEQQLFSMTYHSSLESDPSWLQEQYATKREQELRLGTTLVGPHRDDIEWKTGSVALKNVASLGQARAVALALRFGEWSLLEERSHSRPIFMIDDAESTLDSRRRDTVLSICKENYPQVIITAHNGSTENGKKLFVEQGSVRS